MRFELITETINTFRKYTVYPLYLSVDLIGIVILDIPTTDSLSKSRCSRPCFHSLVVGLLLTAMGFKGTNANSLKSKSVA